MKLQNGKSFLENESAYMRSMKDVESNKDYLNDLHNFLKVENQIKNTINYSKDFTRTRYLSEADEISHTLSYIPKRHVKFIPSNLMSYGNPSSNMAYRKSQETSNAKGKSVKNSDSNSDLANTNSVFYNYGFHNKSVDADYLNFKTNFILKFARNISAYEKLFQVMDSVSDNNKKFVSESFMKLKSLSEKKDRILFDNNELKSSSNFNWKENIILFYEFETIWQKISDVILKELKSTREIMISLAKKNTDLEAQVKENAAEIYNLTEFIRINDLQNKAATQKKKLKHFYDMKQEYERKENLNLINLHRLEEEVKDLTGLLDKDKDYLNKYKESLELLEQKKKEMEEIRLKLNQDLDDKKLKITQLNIEKHENHLRVIELEKNLQEAKSTNKGMTHEFIEYQTHIKILSETIESKKENIEMLSNEVEAWIMELHKERIAHYNSEQNVSALEFKLQAMKNEKPK